MKGFILKSSNLFHKGRVLLGRLRVLRLLGGGGGSGLTGYTWGVGKVIGFSHEFKDRGATVTAAATRGEGGWVAALLVWMGELDLGGRIVKVSGELFGKSAGEATVVWDLDLGSVTVTFSKIISVSTSLVAVSVTEGPAEICWLVGEERAAVAKAAKALERRVWISGERGGKWMIGRWEGGSGGSGGRRFLLSPVTPDGGDEAERRRPEAHGFDIGN